MLCDDIKSRSFVYNYDVFHICSKPCKLLRLYESPPILFCLYTLYTPSHSAWFRSDSIYITFIYEPVYHPAFCYLHVFLLILLFPLLILTFILGLVIPLLIFLLKIVLYIIVYLRFSLLILHYIILHFLLSINTSIVFISLFRITLLLI